MEEKEVERCRVGTTLRGHMLCRHILSGIRAQLDVVSTFGIAIIAD